MSEFMSEEELDAYSKEWLDGYDEGFDDGWVRRGEAVGDIRLALIYAASGSVMGSLITLLLVIAFGG